MTGKVFLDRYETIEVLGEGGMGQVFLARDRETAATVVVKVIREELASDPRARNNFASEVRLMTKFRHRHAVTMLKASTEADPEPCIVMEFVPGITLEELLQRHGRLNPTRVGRILGQLCLVLQAAHQADIIHRDLTLENVMVMAPDRAGESIKVMDFGLARMDTATHLSFERLTGDINSCGGGTPDYVSPEQLRGEQIDHRADIYSLGVMLYKLLTGHLPFSQARSMQEIVYAHLQMTPAAFGQRRVYDVSGSIEDVVMFCLQKHPQDRPQSAYELADCYGEALGQPIYEPEEEQISCQSPTTSLQFKPTDIVTTFQAWMPEQIAVWKLRGFVESVNGEIIESVPGLVRISLPQELPSVTTARSKSGSGLFSLLGIRNKEVATNIKRHKVELHMLREPCDDKSRLEIVVVWNSNQIRDRHDDKFQKRMIVELRSFLMSSAS